VAIPTCQNCIPSQPEETSKKRSYGAAVKLKAVCCAEQSTNRGEWLGILVCPVDEGENNGGHNEIEKLASVFQSYHATQTSAFTMLWTLPF